MFLGGALSLSWFAVLVVLQKADYFLTTRDTAPPGSAALGPNTGATSGTPSKRGGVLAEGLAGGGQQQLQQQQRLREWAAQPLLADLDPERSGCDTAAVRCERHSERFDVP